MTEDLAHKTCVECSQHSDPYEEGLMLVGRDEDFQEWEPVMHPEHGFIILYPKDGERLPHPELLASDDDIETLHERAQMDWLCNNCFFKTTWAKENMLDESEVEASYEDVMDVLDDLDDLMGDDDEPL